MSNAKDCIPKKAIAEVLVLRQQDCFKTMIDYDKQSKDDAAVGFMFAGAEMTEVARLLGIEPEFAKATREYVLGRLKDNPITEGTPNK